MPKSNTSARMLPHPSIEDGNRSFPKGDYHVSHKLSENSRTEVVLNHKLEGAPFIQNLIEDGKAKFACLMSVPKIGYRELRISKNSEQKINWNSDIAGKRPPLLRPGILYVGEDLEDGTWTEEDGVAEIWLNQEIYIPKGARLAKGRYLRPKLGELLLRAKCYEEMKPGTFTVSVDTGDGFYFILKAARDVFEFIQRDDSALKHSIITHAVTACFHILKTGYNASDEYEVKNGIEEGEEGSGKEWKHYPNLVALSELLKNRGIDDHWSNDDFDAVKVATELYRIILNDSINSLTPKGE